MRVIKFFDGVVIANGSLIGGIGCAYFTDVITVDEAVDMSAHFFFLFVILYFFVAEKQEEE